MRKRGKQAVRGQKQIHEENNGTILHYSLVSICSSLVVVSLYFWLFQSGTGFWVGWSVAAVLQAVAIGIMYTMVKSIKNERNQVVDAGLDLNDPQAFGEYCKDIVILSAMLQLLSLTWSQFNWNILAIPGLS